jgi:hypothetical protein
MTIMSVFMAPGLALVLFGLLARFRRARPESSSTSASQPIAHTPDGQPIYPVVGYTPDGQPVTADRAVGYSPVRPTNTMAIITLVTSLVFSVLAIPFGHIALSQIKRSGEQGRALAIAGLVIGYVWLAGALIVGTIILVAVVKDW